MSNPAAPDHRTPLRTRAHAHGAVPFIVAGAGIVPRGQLSYDEQVAAQQAYAAPPPAAPAVPDYAAELEQLAQLKNQGIITEDEFEAKKKQILGI